MIKNKFIAIVLASTLLLVGCSSNDKEELKDIQQIASLNFDKYIEAHDPNSFVEVDDFTEFSETEKVLYDFILALNNEDYARAMQFSNWKEQPFVLERDFKNALSSNKDERYNYASIVSKDFNNGLRISTVAVDDLDDIMFTTVLVNDTYEYVGALVNLYGEWKVVVSGLTECIFEVPSNEILYINKSEITNYYKIDSENGIDTYKVLLQNNNTYSTTHKCINSGVSGGIGNSGDEVEFSIVLNNDELNDFVKWELEWYTNVYQALVDNEDLHQYFTNNEIINDVKKSFSEQLENKIGNIKITSIVPTSYLDAPIKYIDENTLEANVSIIISYDYIDNMGKLHTRSGVFDNNTCATFIKDGDTWKMDKMSGTDPVLLNSMFDDI